MIDLNYPNLLSVIKAYLAPKREESTSFLMWFLENIYRLDQYTIQDSVCDGKNDKGIDGIYVDDNAERVDIFQSKIAENSSKQIGDVPLREFAGSLVHFQSKENVERLAQQTINKALEKLLRNQKVADKIEDGYEVRGVYVTNILPNNLTSEYLLNESKIILYDKNRILHSYVPPGQAMVIHKPVTFALNRNEYTLHTVRGMKVIFASLKAMDLINLDGIDSGALFAWNVRQSLGRTKVNKDIAGTIHDSKRHHDFLLFHNGLTILAKKVEDTKNGILIDEYAVVNGCQSLSTIYEHKALLTDSLKLVCRIVQIDPGEQFAQEITHHTNNQNPINARDLQANSSIQRRLQEEFEKHYFGKVFYAIKRGETSTAPILLENELSARVMLAFDLKEPWTCHQTYKLFDDLHTQIFNRPEVNADRIFVLFELYKIAESLTPKVDYETMGHYRLTTYFILYLLRQAIEETDDLGKKFCQSPGDFLKEQNGLTRINRITADIVQDLLYDINAEIKERVATEGYFDFKSILKSPKAVGDLARNIIPQYQKGVNRQRATAFGEEWKQNK